MYCVRCGKAYEPFYTFCNHCGYPLPSNIGQDEPEGAPGQRLSGTAALLDTLTENPINAGEAQTATGIAALPIQCAPYATFVSLALGSALLISVLAFNVAVAMARVSWDATTSTVVATVGAALLAQRARGAWRQIIAAEPNSDSMFRLRHRRVLRNSAVIILLFFMTAAIVGATIGQGRAEAVRLTADLERMATLGNGISKARSTVEATIASCVRMYKAIAPDVQELESTIRRLKGELAVYDAKFPAQHEQTSKSIEGVEMGLRRAALLKQQIEVAQEIEALDPGQQLAAWRTQMLPVLATEEALDKAK